MKNRWRLSHMLAFLVVGLALALGVLIAVQIRFANHASVGPTVSKETTRITEPLRADGSVDYVAALDARARVGVTVDNNASVLLWQAFGPASINPAMRVKYFERLGIEIPPVEGEYFVSDDEYLKQWLAADPSRLDSPESNQRLETEFSEALDTATSRLWTADEFPMIAAWLQAIDRPLSLVTEASNRPRRYDPLLGCTPEETSVVEIALPVVERCNKSAKALGARAMLHLGIGNVAGARQDALTCHRLASLVGQGPTLVEGLVQAVIGTTACRVEQSIAHYGKLTQEEIAASRKDIHGVPPLSMLERIDVHERFQSLDAVQTCARFRKTGEADILFDLKRAVATLKNEKVDWDLICTMINSRWDRLCEAYRTPDRSARILEFEAMDREFTDLAKRNTAANAAKILTMGRKRAVSEAMGNVIMSLLLPAGKSLSDAETRYNLEIVMTDLALALAAFRNDHGHYPEKLADLVPDLIVRVPDDPFGDGPLSYSAVDDGYYRSSVGPDGRRAPLDDQEFSDDLIVRMPWQPTAISR